MPAAKIYTYPVLIKEIYLDVYGHVNNATYLTLFEEARWEITTMNGWGLKKIMEEHIGPIILEAKLRYLKEMKLRESIIIETQATSYVKKIGKLSQKMMRGAEVCCEAEFTVGLFDLKARKLMTPTQDWFDAIGWTEEDLNISIS